MKIVKLNLLLFSRYDRIPVASNEYGGYSVVVNTSGCGPEDRGFKSHYSPKADGLFHWPFLNQAPLAQRIERQSSKLNVVGSNPSGRIFSFLLLRLCDSKHKLAAMAPLPSVPTILEKLSTLNVLLPFGAVRVDGYGDSAALSEALLTLIREGRKRAGTGLLWAIEADGEAISNVGDIEIVLDYFNEPALVTRITQVNIVAFGEVSAEYAAIEGEGDGSLAYWREAHWAFFSRECQRIGRQPTESMPVVCSEFEVLNILPFRTAT